MGFRLSDVTKLETIDNVPTLENERPLFKALSGESNTGELIIFNKSGNKIPVSFVTTSLRDESDEIWGAIVVFKDITKEKQAERAKTDFLAIASHEMRTPLTIIKGKAERLLKKLATDDVKVKEDILGIKRNGDRLLGIVNDFLDTILLEDNRMKFSISTVDLKKIISDVIDELSIKATAKGIGLKLANDGSLDQILIQADPERLKQVMINIINNAINYTEKGGVTISIATFDGTYAVRVTDTGIGISSEKQKGLFQKFVTANGSFMQTQEYGSGLGLYIANLIMVAMGGEIKLEKSVPNEGSTFVIILKK